MPSMDLYFRSDTHTINGLNAYKVLETNSASSANIDITVNAGPIPGQVSTHGDWTLSSIDIRHVNSSETNIATGVANTNRTVFNTTQQGIQSNTYAIAETAMASTDALKFTWQQVLADGYGGTNTAVFVTEQLGWEKINAATWTIYRYTYAYNLNTDVGLGGPWLITLVVRLYWGDGTYTTYIDGVDYTGGAYGDYGFLI